MVCPSLTAGLPTLNWWRYQRTSAWFTISYAIGSVELREVGSVALSESVA